MDSVTQLFTDKNVENMNELEKKTRREIELKKEELRQMVGERYRDLIEAADTIAEMKRCSANVGDSIKDLKQFCSAKSVRTKTAMFFKPKPAGNNHKRYMEISAEAKVLMELPEKIWSHVEEGHMVNASFLYLQSLQVLKNLSLSASYSPILLWFPMLGQQAQAVANLGSAILKQCNSRLSDHLMDPSKTAEALCSIVLLEKRSAFDIFMMLLRSRKSVISEILSSDSAGNSYHSLGAKVRICESISVLVQTVLHISKLFCEESGGLVTELLRKCATQSSQDVIDKFMGKHEATKLWSKHLPAETTKDLANLSNVELVINQELMQAECISWLAGAKQTIVIGIKDLLQFTANAKDLATIKSSLLEVINIDPGLESDPNQSEWFYAEGNPAQEAERKWHPACLSVFKRELNVWEEILKDLFLEKVNQLVTSTFDDLLTDSKQVFSSYKSGTHVSVCSYVWQEHEDDIPPSMAWNHWQSRKSQILKDQGGLSLKALTITPSVHKLCSVINSAIAALLNDLEYYVPEITKSKADKRKPMFGLQQELEPDTDVEGKAIRFQLRTICLQFLNNLLKYISTLIDEFKSDTNEPTPESCAKVLELSLVCRNFFEICTTCRLCCSLPEENPKQTSLRSQYRDMVTSRTKVDIADSEWNNVVEAMNVQCRELMCVWCNSILSNVYKEYKHQLLCSVENGDLLRTITTWDLLSVEEESETGSTVTSQIRVPASTTSFTQRLLYSLCSNITNVGGFATCRYTLRDVSQNCLKSVLEAFSELRHTLSTADTSLHGQSRSQGEAMPPSQTWALQLLFDLRYIHTLLYQAPLMETHSKDVDDDDDDDDLDTDLGEESSTYTFTELVDWLESFVDPFDLDVFSPHLTRNIQGHVQRTSVMLGILAAPDRVGTTGQQKLGIVKDSHNVLPMAANCGRFSYLPVSGRSNRSHKRLTSTISRQLPLASALQDLTRTVDEDEEKNSQQKKLSSSIYSKLGALSSSWLSMSSSYTEQ